MKIGEQLSFPIEYQITICLLLHIDLSSSFPVYLCDTNINRSNISSFVFVHAINFNILTQMRVSQILHLFAKYKAYGDNPKLIHSH